MSSSQLTLFGEPSSRPDGLRYQPDFISPSAEEELLGRIKALPLAPFQFGVFEGKRRVVSFGSRYDYSDRRVLGAEPLPDWLQTIVKAVETFANLRDGAIRQALITEYEAGVGIGWHRDKPHYGQVFGLSLASACRLRLRRKSGAKWERFTLKAQPRSLYALASDARHVWEHSIPPVEAIRYSVTLRTAAA